MSLASTVSQPLSADELLKVSKKAAPMIERVVDPAVGDAVVYAEKGELWAGADDIVGNKKLRVKLEPRIFVISRFRLLGFGKSKDLKKYSVLENRPLLALEEVADRTDYVALRFRTDQGATFVAVKGARSDKLQEALSRAYHDLTLGWPEQLLARFEGSSAPPSTPHTPGDSVRNSFYAYCDYFNTFPKSVFVNALADMANRGTELDLGDLCGLERGDKSEFVIDAKVLGQVLAHNGHFRALTMRNVERDELNQIVAAALEGNRVLTRVIWTRCIADAGVQAPFGLARNSRHQVQVLQLGGNGRLPVLLLLNLAEALRDWPHALRVLDLSDLSLSLNNTCNIVSALMMNYPMSVGLQELSLAGCPLSGDAGRLFVRFLAAMREQSKLRRLCLARTGIDFGPVAQELSSMQLTFLDLSDNRVRDPSTLALLVNLAEKTRTLQTLCLAGVELPHKILVALLKALFNNKALKELHLDLSRNRLAESNFLSFAFSFDDAEHLKSLDVSDNNLRERGVIDLVKHLPSGLQRFVCDRNDVGAVAAEQDEFVSVMTAFLAAHTQMDFLSLGAGPTATIDASVWERLLPSLAALRSLRAIRLPGHALGDALVAQLSDTLRGCAQLSGLDVDGNGLTHLGLIALKNLALSTPSLVFIKWLQHDLRALKGALHPRALKVALDVYGVLARRRDAGDAPWPPNPLDFDQKWPIPTGKPAPLAAISDQLQALSTKTRAEVSFSRELDVDEAILNVIDTTKSERRSSSRLRTKSHTKRESDNAGSPGGSGGGAGGPTSAGGAATAGGKRSIKIVGQDEIEGRRRESGSLDVSLTMAHSRGSGGSIDVSLPIAMATTAGNVNVNNAGTRSSGGSVDVALPPAQQGDKDSSGGNSDDEDIDSSGKRSDKKKNTDTKKADTPSKEKDANMSSGSGRPKSGSVTAAKVVDGKWSVGDGEAKSPPRASASGHRSGPKGDLRDKDKETGLARTEAVAATERARSALKRFTTTTVKLTKLPLGEEANDEVAETVTTLRTSLGSLWDEASALDAIEAQDEGVHARQNAMVSDVQALWPLAVDVLTVITQIRAGNADANAYAKALTPIVSLVKGLKVTLEALSWEVASLASRDSRLPAKPTL